MYEGKDDHPQEFHLGDREDIFRYHFFTAISPLFMVKSPVVACRKLPTVIRGAFAGVTLQSLGMTRILKLQKGDADFIRLHHCVIHYTLDSIHTYIHHIHIYIYVHIHIYIYIYMYMYIHTYIYICIPIYIYIDMYICTYRDVHMCIWICTYIQIWTDIS